MDENPYQSPTATDDAIEPSTTPGAPRKPPSGWEVVLFGGMVGVLYHSVAGGIMGCLFGLYQAAGAETTGWGHYVSMAIMFGYAGAIIGVVTGAVVGPVVAGMYSALRRRRFGGCLAWTIARGLHLLLGWWAGLAVAPKENGAWYYDLVPSGAYFALSIGGGICGMACGWIVGRLVDRRIRRTLESLGESTTDDTH